MLEVLDFLAGEEKEGEPSGLDISPPSECLSSMCRRTCRSFKSLLTNVLPQTFRYPPNPSMTKSHLKTSFGSWFKLCLARWSDLVNTLGQCWHGNVPKFLFFVFFLAGSLTWADMVWAIVWRGTNIEGLLIVQGPNWHRAVGAAKFVVTKYRG